ncbi:MAG: hypothetical protein HKL82_07720 [Acidimicrobiaceae bacterium]|nr:hypothetical protein [Acidimicrobiaceae bacterium]
MVKSLLKQAGLEVIYSGLSLCNRFDVHISVLHDSTKTTKRHPTDRSGPKEMGRYLTAFLDAPISCRAMSSELPLLSLFPDPSIASDVDIFAACIPFLSFNHLDQAGCGRRAH